MDTRSESGSHWIAITIYSIYLFVCDSLGLIKPRNTPEQLVNFLHLFSINRKLYITRQLQHP